MTTYCIDENKNLVNTLAITKREFVFNIQIQSSVQENNAWSFSIEYNTELLSFINTHTNNILAVNLSGTIFNDTNTTMFPAYTSCASTYAYIEANIIIKGYSGVALVALTDMLSLLFLNMNNSITITPDLEQGNTYTLVVTVYVAS